MKKIGCVILIMIMIVSFNSGTFAESYDVNNLKASSLIDSKKLFKMMKNSVELTGLEFTELAPNLDSLEQEKYDSISYVEGLTEENRIVVAKMMAYRYREAQQLSKDTFEGLLSKPKLSNTSSGTDIRVAAYYVQNKPVAIRLYQDYMTILTDPWIENSALVAMAMRDQQFISYVKTGGPWDLKGPLGVYNSYLLLGTTRTGEYIGNHHYGYMGRHAGYGETYLKIGAGIYQIVSGTSKWAFMSSYFDDPSDAAAISKGYSNYGIDLGKGIFY